MARITLRQLLDHAAEHEYGVPAFNINKMEQALAIMDHPSIARVFDGGATPEGRPYFVMEFVDGPPITKFCDDVRLGISERTAPGYRKGSPRIVARQASTRSRSATLLST